MPPSNEQIKLVARLTALEILVQHLIFVACDRDPQAIRDYAQRLRETYSQARVPGTDPATSDLWAAETEQALAAILDDLIRRAEGQQ